MNHTPQTTALPSESLYLGHDWANNRHAEAGIIQPLFAAIPGSLIEERRCGQ